MQQKSDNVVSHYVFEAPVRIWHWLTVLCMAVLMVTGYFIGKPLPSVSGEATYLFYMGYIRLIHFSAGMIFTVVLLMRIYWAFVGNRYSRELFIVPVWRKSWWQGVWYEIRWYLFLAKRPSADIGHNPIAQAAMFGYFLMSVFMIITGFALYSEHSQYAIFAPFRYVVEFFYWTGGNSMDIHSWHRLGMWLIGAFVIGHVYMALRGKIDQHRWVLKMALWSLPLPWIAIEAGWFMTEFGRQPWAIQDILPTYSAHSALTTGQLAFSLIMIVGLYTLFLIAEVYLMQKYARLGPSAMQSEQPTQQQG